MIALMPTISTSHIHDWIVLSALLDRDDRVFLWLIVPASLSESNASESATVSWYAILSIEPRIAKPKRRLRSYYEVAQSIVSILSYLRRIPEGMWKCHVTLSYRMRRDHL